MENEPICVFMHAIQPFYATSGHTAQEPASEQKTRSTFRIMCVIYNQLAALSVLFPMITFAQTQQLPPPYMDPGQKESFMNNILL